MATRIIALVFLGLFLAFIAVMASVTLFVKDPLPIVGPNQRLVLETVEIAPPLRAEIAVDGDFKALVSVSPLDDVRRVRLRPAGGNDVALEQQGELAEAQFTRTGRWELVLDAGGTQEVLAFVLRD
ncbi:hypothetical protein ROE7235_00402 [Roseibaca ekhonensis]|jgi:hypothetical protein|uniref:Uncharacterized protein n=1 Tax=Roseinatronobacter ekhonensis TaxID=254356 RepID=A0A3B0MRS2_9RHOB|nr:hypothetical protein [Roseibaca ekhonensis]SUZ30676.1 hypothetical protein ROE7235_00402 [Roseibaca ekhonensis]